MSKSLTHPSQGLGYDSVKAQLMTVVVYACSIVSVLFWAVYSDRTNRRGLPVMITSLIMATGYLIMIIASPTQLKVRFFGCILMGMGGYPVILLCLMWLVVNTISLTKRATGLAFFFIIGQLFGIAGNQAYRDPPYYRKGHASSLGASLLTFFCAAACYFYLGWKNDVKKKRLGNLAEAEEVERLRGLDWDVVGDDHPDFMYTV
jgi:MFS family permease